MSRSILNVRILGHIAVGIAAGLMFVSSALADDWKAIKLRGAVFALENDKWVPLERGSIVSDTRVIRTAKNGRAQFQRDKETISLEPNTQIKIFDYADSKFTVVQQHFGEVAIEAERRDVQHFAVQTKYLVAVVKGTKFTVRADGLGANVSVQRGQVQVRDTERQELVEVEKGQSAGAGEANGLQVSGSGDLHQVVKYTGSARSAEVTIIANAKSNAGGNSSANASTKSNAGGNSGANASAKSNAGGNSGTNASSNSNAGGNSGANASANSNAGGNSGANASSNSAVGKLAWLLPYL